MRVYGGDECVCVSTGQVSKSGALNSETAKAAPRKQVATEIIVLIERMCLSEFVYSAVRSSLRPGGTAIINSQIAGC